MKIKVKITKKKIIQFTSIIFIMGLIAILLFAFQPSKTKPENGLFDLNNKKDSDTINLNGEWDFYWEKFISYDDILMGVKKDITADTTSFWNNYKINDEKLPAFGYATYVLKVVNGNIGDEISIRIPSISSAYKFYINDTILTSVGKVGIDKQSHQGETKTQIIEFTLTQSDFYIIIHVSNYTTAYGGLYYALTLGTPFKINSINQSDYIVDIFSLGALLVMIVYHLSFAYLDKGEKINRKINLILVLICILYALQILIHNGSIAFIGFEAMLILDYLLLFWFSVCGLLLFNSLYPKESYKNVKIGLIIYAGVMSIIVLLTPIAFFTKFILFYEIITILISIYLLVSLSIAFLRNRNYSFTLLIVAFVILLCTLHDLAFSSIPIFGYIGELIPFSILFLLITQPFLHARYAVDSLNKIVDTETAFMQAQIKPHFLYNVLSVISSYCDTDPIYVQKLIDNFSNYLRLSFDFKKIESCIPIEKEISLVKAYVEIQKARFPDLLNIIYDIDENIDVQVPLLSIQPLVENAITHGILPKNTVGFVKLRIRTTEEGTTVSVIDDGVGISYKNPNGFINEENESGIGLYNIDKRLKKLYNKGLSISSIEDAGTTVKFTIPAKRRKR